MLTVLAPARYPQEFAHCAGLRDKSEQQPTSGSRRKNMHVVDLKGLFTEINQEEVATNKAKQLENDVNDDDAFLRFEFLECVMYVALSRTPIES